MTIRALGLTLILRDGMLSLWYLIFFSLWKPKHPQVGLCTVSDGELVGATGLKGSASYRAVTHIKWPRFCRQFWISEQKSRTGRSGSFGGAFYRHDDEGERFLTTCQTCLGMAAAIRHT